MPSWPLFATFKVSTTTAKTCYCQFKVEHIAEEEKLRASAAFPIGVIVEPAQGNSFHLDLDLHFKDEMVKCVIARFIKQDVVKLVIFTVTDASTTIIAVQRSNQRMDHH